MPTVTSRTFRSGNSEAVRLPREVAFGKDIEVTIVRSGDVITIYPKRTPIAEMLAQLRELPAPPTVQTRDKIPFPKRKGL